MDELGSSILIGWLIGGLICGVFGGAIASNKGADSRTGFLLGAFLGPLGVLIAAFLTPPAIANSSLSPSNSSQSAPIEIERPPTPQSLENAQYRLWLTKAYSITKNEVLGEYVCGDKAFPSGDEALRYAHELEINKTSAAEAQKIEREAKLAEEAANLGIRFDGTSYIYKIYKYSTLKDALAYAKLDTASR